MTERRAVTRQMAARYARGSKAEKGRILDELCALTGWSRRHARRALCAPGRGPAPQAPRRVARTYGAEVLSPLILLWATLGGPCGKRLAPFMAEAVQAMERFGELDLAPEVRRKLLSVSAATIDRLLVPERRRLRVRGRSGTKPGSLLKHQVPIRTFAEWDEASPGFCEVDLVGHDGGSAAGQYCQSLTVTDVATGWTEVRAIPNKAQRWVFEALLDVRAHLPFPLLGLDSDNGSEFINNDLVDRCSAEGITFTRSRPWRKNDSCFVEQKNWSVVRQAAGYARYDTVSELQALRELYGHLGSFVNFFSPQMKLASKTRQGARVHRHYDRAQTPFQRAVASPALAEEAKASLRARYLRLNPAQLRRDLGRAQDRLLECSRDKAKVPLPQVRAPGAHPWRSAALPGRGAGSSRTSSMRQRTDPSRTS